jgi:hypothetical protein
MNNFDFDAKIRNYSANNAYWVGTASLLAYKEEEDIQPVLYNVQNSFL